MRLRALSPLRHRAYRLLVGGQLASNIGDAFYAVALPWYILETHGGALKLGELLAVYGIARAAMILVGGHLSDRYRPWVTMMGADIVRAVAVGVFTVVVASGPARIWLMAPIAAIVGAGEGIFLPASFSIVPELLPDEDLQAGNALTSSGSQLSMLAGPAFAGLVVALVGPAPAFGVDAASFAISALSLAMIRRSPKPEVDTGDDPETEVDTRTVWQIIRTERLVPLLFAVDIVANLGSGGTSEVAIPALAHGPFDTGSTGYGVLLAAWACGALAGTIVAGQIETPRRPAIVASAGFIAAAAFIAAMPYLGGAFPAGVMLAGSGMTMGFANVLTGTAFQRWAPRPLLGRLTSVSLLASFGIFPVSVLLGGLVVHAFGPAIFMPLSGAALAITLLFALTQPEWRSFGKQQTKVIADG